MNLSDLDALAQRSGLRPPPVAPHRSVPRLKIPRLAFPGALILAALAALVAAIVSATGLVRAADQADRAARATAAHECAVRWHGSRPLYVDHQQFSVIVGCGRRSDRVVLGHVEIADP